MSRLALDGTAWVLVFDIENRPLSYWYADRPTAEVTAVASYWIHGLPRMTAEPPLVDLLGEVEPELMLEHIASRIGLADLVIGHYIRKHDLPIINGALIEFGMDPLEAVLTHDTKLDLLKFGDLPGTQENVAHLMGVRHPKVHMTQADWREANRLTPAGLAKTKKRVAGDIKQNAAMYKTLVKRGLLKAPKVWRP